VKLRLDIDNAEINFAAAVAKMGKLTGLNPKMIVLSEAGSVLKRCFEMSPAPPSQSELTRAGRLRSLKALGLTGRRGVSEITINAGGNGAKYGRVFIRKKSGDGFRRTHDNNFHPLNQHYKDWQWEDLTGKIQAAKMTVKKVVPEVKASAGIARQSWDLIAVAAGIRLEEVPGGNVSASQIMKVRGARVRGNRQVNNGLAKAVESPGKFYLELINRLPFGKKIGFDRILLVAMAGRAKYMETAIKKGFQGSLTEAAKLFPGWTIK
jgi:hypothetical protein